MSLKNRFLRGGLTLSAGQLVSQALSVLRNVLVARLIATEADFGIASILIMCLAIYELITNIGVNILVVQDPEGDQPHFQNVVHFAAVLRGMASALLLLAFAYPLALMFGIPQAAWAFAWLAAIPVIRGLMHFDIFRLQREHQFIPAILQETASQFVAVVACVPFLSFFRDYSAVLYILILQTAVMTAMSHLLSTRPYRWGRDQKTEQRIISFGVPLMFNGLLYFLISQGDRVALGSSGQLFASAHYTIEDLASYSAAYMIATLAPQFLTRILTSLFMPLLSRSEGHSFIQNSAKCIEAFAFAGTIVAIPSIVYGDLIVQILFGGRYASAGLCIVFAAFAQSIFVLRSGVTLPLMARGCTWDVLVNSMWRCSAFLGTLAVAVADFPVAFIAIPAIAGETVAVVLLAAAVRTRLEVPLGATFKPLIAIICGLSLAASLRVFSYEYLPPLLYFAFGIIFYLGFIVTWISISPTTSGFLQRLAINMAWSRATKTTV